MIRDCRINNERYSEKKCFNQAFCVLPQSSPPRQRERSVFPLYLLSRTVHSIKTSWKISNVHGLLKNIIIIILFEKYWDLYCVNKNILNLTISYQNWETREDAHNVYFSNQTVIGVAVDAVDQSWTLWRSSKGPHPSWNLHSHIKQDIEALPTTDCCFFFRILIQSLFGNSRLKLERIFIIRQYFSTEKCIMVSKTFRIKRIMKWRKYIFKGSIVAKNMQKET